MTYLSLDLDYWLAACWSELPPLAGLFRILRQVKTDNWLIVDEHHHLLEHIDTANPSTILHVDYHTDVAYPLPAPKGAPSTEPEELELNCGTFFWFVKGREKMNYTWFYPELRCPQGPGLCMDESYQPLARKNWIFQEQRRKLGLPTKKQLSEVTTVGIAVSQDYCHADKEYLLRLLKVLRKRYIPAHAVWKIPHELEV